MSQTRSGQPFSEASRFPPGGFDRFSVLVGRLISYLSDSRRTFCITPATGCDVKSATRPTPGRTTVRQAYGGIVNDALTVAALYGPGGRHPADRRMHGRPTMALEWFTYAALGERLGITPEAVRQRAIRHEWSKRTGNDGRAEVRVDVEELIAAQPPAPPPKPQADPPSDTGPTPDRDPVVHPADDRATDALVASLREMIARADAQAERADRQAADERARADKERDRANALAAELVKIQAEGSRHVVAGVERDVAQLRAVLDEMRQADAPTMKPWWQGIADALARRPA